VGLIVNKFGDKIKKVQCNAINNLSKVVARSKDNDTFLKLVIAETLLFL
jgi:hypothetical protein